MQVGVWEFLFGVYLLSLVDIIACGLWFKHLRNEFVFLLRLARWCCVYWDFGYFTCLIGYRGISEWLITLGQLVYHADTRDDVNRPINPIQAFYYLGTFRCYNFLPKHANPLSFYSKAVMVIGKLMLRHLNADYEG